jgi:hypothetical protein
MRTNRASFHLHLFLLRLWRERVDEDQFEWRGEVKNTSNGEIRYFRDHASLYRALLVLLDGATPAPEPPTRGAADENDLSSPA